MADYTDEIKSAYDSIKGAGVAVEVCQASLGTYSPSSDSFTTATWSCEETYAVIKQFSNRFIDGTRIKVGDQELLIPAYEVNAVLGVGDRVTIGDETWEVINPNPIKPGGETILYKAHVRRIS